VLFAVAVFAMVAVGSLAIMNQGTATAQRSLEITLVRQQIYAQSEAIRYIHAAYVAAYQQGGGTLTGTAAEWPKMTLLSPGGHGATQASAFGDVAGGSCPETVPGQSPFILNARTAKVWDNAPAMSAPSGHSLPPFAQVIYDGAGITNAYGLWIEAVPDSDAVPAYVDFHIRACWSSPGATVPMTLGTIVRLYDPAI
jgi:hypothetical protein